MSNLHVLTGTLTDQIEHAVVAAICLMALGVVAWGVDVFAGKLEKLGASSETVGLMRRAGHCLLALDLVVLVIVVVVGCASLVGSLNFAR